LTAFYVLIKQTRTQLFIADNGHTMLQKVFWHLEPFRCDRQTDRQTNRQTDRQTDRQTHSLIAYATLHYAAWPKILALNVKQYLRQWSDRCWPLKLKCHSTTEILQ